MGNINLIIVGIVILILAVLMLAGNWKVNEKAGQDGWACIIPIYGTLINLRIIGKPWWWLLLMCIPYIGAIWGIMQIHFLSKSFGKDLGFTLGLIFLPFIFYPILGYGTAQYEGPYGNPEAYDAYRKSKQSFDFEQNNFAENNQVIY